MPLCPSCGREVGSSVTCPYCGANLKRRLTIALFGVLAIVLAIGGLALLYYTSVNTIIPTIRIRQIQAAMNYAYVRIEGIVRRAPRFNADSESLSFAVDDGSGQMTVSAFRDEARALIAADRVPSIGDLVSIAGGLRVRDETPSLTIISADALTLTRAIDAAALRPIDSITVDDALRGVTVRGQVRAVREPFGGLRLITLRDASGEIDVAVDSDITAFGADAPETQVGDSVEVTGVVTLFEDAPQIALTRGDRLSLLSAPMALAELVPIRELNDASIGRWVQVQGVIANVSPFSAGMKFTLNDTQGREVVLLLWRDLFDALPGVADWQIGAEVAAQGQVNSFRGELEIVPEIAQDVAILSRAASETPDTLTLTPIGAITAKDIDRSVFISGTIQSVDRFSSGARFRVADKSGSILLVLFDDVLEQVEDVDRLEAGAGVSALGRVSEFNGALEVIPPNGASVRVAPAPVVAQASPTPAATLIPTTRATPPPQGTSAPTAAPTLAAPDTIAISTIDASRIGQLVTVRGQIIATASFSSGFRFTLNDGSGSIVLVLFDGRYRELSNRAALNLGAQVTAKARVVEFNGRLELQPDSGGDVIVEKPGSSSLVTVRAINTLTQDDAGKLAAIVGDVLRVEGFSSGVSVFVNDGTAELRVVIFNNVLNYVPNAPSLQAGARVRVAGRLDVFNGALELLPALGYDVTINP